MYATELSPPSVTGTGYKQIIHTEVVNMKSRFQISESVEIGIVLALAGGFMDAYSYMCRGEVFANAQTGNILLFGINLSSGNFKAALYYALPVTAFAFGIVMSEIIRHRLKSISILHWRQISIVFEILILFGVGFFPQKYNLPANCLTSLACGIQVESFRKIHGNGIATTMCIGNLRSAMQNLSDYFYSKNRQSLKKGILYLSVILFFAVGAVIGNLFVNIISEKAIFLCCAILTGAFLMMFIDREKATSNKA